LVISYSQELVYKASYRVFNIQDIPLIKPAKQCGWKTASIPQRKLPLSVPSRQLMQISTCCRILVTVALRYRA